MKMEAMAVSQSASVTGLLAVPEEAPCFHCGLAVPRGTTYCARVDGISRRMCCRGCQAVAEAIVAHGLESYYHHRTALAPRGQEAAPAFLEQLHVYDNPDVQRSFVRVAGPHVREAALILEGITCAACVWLNEQHLSQIAGVLSVDINYSTRRAYVRWDDRKLELSAILRAVSDIGYTAHPFDTARFDEVQRRERKTALWRLFVAGFGMMQVMMYAYPTYIADGDMSADIESLMRWASLLLTAPVVLYSAAPFFSRRVARSQDAPRRHGRAGSARRGGSLHRERLGDAARQRRGVLRLDHDVRLPAAWRAVPRDERAREGLPRSGRAAEADPGLCGTACPDFPRCAQPSESPCRCSSAGIT